MSTRIFTDVFLNADISMIQHAIRTDGFYMLQGALTPEWIAEVNADVARHPFAINNNWVTGVHAENQYYLTHMLACSQAFFRYCTHSRIFNMCEALLGETYRLKAMRYYETYGRHRMQWHTDNKTDRGFAHIPGLIFICYLADVNDGEFQYVRGSQNWSGDKAYSDYTDAFIQENHGKDVVSFKAPAGTMVIYDTYGIHRARPVADPRFVRKSLFFQVDSKIDSAEPILLNPSFVPVYDVNPQLLRYLGFGQPAEYEVYPSTSLKHLQLRRLSLKAIAQWMAYRLLRGIYNLAPLAVVNFIRKLMRKPAL